MLVEGFLKSWGRVETVLHLLDNVDLDPSISLDDIIDAANECGNKTSTLQYLQQECQICFTTCSRNKVGIQSRPKIALAHFNSTFNC